MPPAISATLEFHPTANRWISAPGSRFTLAITGILSMRDIIAVALAAFLSDAGATQAMFLSQWFLGNIFSNISGLPPKRLIQPANRVLARIAHKSLEICERCRL